MTREEFMALVRGLQVVSLELVKFSLPGWPVSRVVISLNGLPFVTENGRGLFELQDGLLGFRHLHVSEFTMAGHDLVTSAGRTRARAAVRRQLVSWLKKVGA